PRAAEIAAHGAALERALEQVRQQVRWHDFDGVFSYLLHVLQVFGWCLPASIPTESASDVSIYNHARSSAAIATCLFAAVADASEAVDSPDCAIAVLVKGDISGTEDFLYLVTNAGAACGLRGRSFYLQLLGESVARWMLRQFSLPATNLLFAGGGHFYLLLPAEELKARWDVLRRTIAEKLWRAHQGGLSLAMGRVELRAGDFPGFAEKWAAVSRAAGEAKQRKWIELGGEAMMEALFTPRQHGTTAEEMCQVCQGEYDGAGGDRENNGVRRCRRCEGFEELGRELRNATHLVTFTVPDGAAPENAIWRETLESFGAAVHLLDRTSDAPDAPSQAASAHVELLQPGGFADRFRWDGLPTGYGVRLLADATPMKSEGEIADFKDLAEAADGVKWLGALRMDVDDLGRVLLEGLSRQATIARISALSESLRWFFESRVAGACRAQNRRGGSGKDSVYLIHAGGDDLFVVGAWSALPPLAAAIRDEFHALVGGDHVTLSAGIAVEGPAYPFHQLAADARRALEEGAKAFRPEKNAICFLQKPVGWRQFKRADHWRDELTKMLEDKRRRMPRAVLARLDEIHAIYEENARRQQRRRRDGRITLDEMKEERHFAQWQWRLVYHLDRFGRRHPDHQEKIEQFQQEITREDARLIPLLRIIARWTELQTRKSSL
ncbi:MAG: type III-A CRISPR-associated protein Cas10/Csm1, partial [Blastocatellia bacterium]